MDIEVAGTARPADKRVEWQNTERSEKRLKSLYKIFYLLLLPYLIPQIYFESFYLYREPLPL
jgi:hypothetical protein